MSDRDRLADEIDQHWLFRTRPHIPRVRVISPEPDHAGVTPAIFQRVLVDGAEWAVTDYTIRAKVQDVQMVTLTFLADVTVERPTTGDADA